MSHFYDLGQYRFSAVINAAVVELRIVLSEKRFSRVPSQPCIYACSPQRQGLIVAGLSLEEVPVILLEHENMGGLGGTATRLFLICAVLCGDVCTEPVSYCLLGSDGWAFLPPFLGEQLQVMSGFAASGHESLHSRVPCCPHC